MQLQKGSLKFLGIFSKIYLVMGAGRHALYIAFFLSFFRQERNVTQYSVSFEIKITFLRRLSLFFTINRKPSIESISRIGNKYTSRRSVLMTLLAWKQKWWDFKYKGSKSFFAKFWESKTSIDTLLRWWPHSQKECSKISLILTLCMFHFHQAERRIFNVWKTQY